MDAADVDLAWLLGMLHDVGRFEQLRRYGTFIDADSTDHAQLRRTSCLVQESLNREEFEIMCRAWRRTY